MPTLAPSSACHLLETPRLLDLVRADVARITALLAEGSPSRPAPSCPRWDLDHLVGHIGEIHRWAAAIVTRRPQHRIELSDAEVGKPADWSATVEWFAAGGAALIDALSAADPDAPCWAWGGDRHVRFWLRRMLHETAIHRVDVETAVLGQPGELDAAVAVDNIDEFLDNVPYMARFRPEVRELHGDGETIHLHATDLDGSELPGEWLITLEPDGFRWSHAHVKGMAAVRGTAAQLALWVNHRLPEPAAGLERIGEEPLLAHWSAKAVF